MSGSRIGWGARPRHDELDAAVFAAYRWSEPPGELDDETMLGRLLALNLERATNDPTP